MAVGAGRLAVTVVPVVALIPATGGVILLIFALVASTVYVTLLLFVIRSIPLYEDHIFLLEDLLQDLLNNDTILSGAPPNF